MQGMAGCSGGFRWSPWGRCREQPGVHWGAHSIGQPSSSQRPQQINLPVTLHLDCINVELGPITAIGRTWQSHSTAILVSQERPLLNRGDKAFFSQSRCKAKGVITFFSLSFNPVISTANQPEECARALLSTFVDHSVGSKEWINAFERSI